MRKEKGVVQRLFFFPFNAPCKLKITHTRCNLSVFLWQDMTSINTYTLGNKEYLMATY